MGPCSKCGLSFDMLALNHLGLCCKQGRTGALLAAGPGRAHRCCEMMAVRAMRGKVATAFSMATNFLCEQLSRPRSDGPANARNPLAVSRP